MRYRRDQRDHEAINGDAELLRRAQAGDVTSRNTIAVANLGLVASVVAKMRIPLREQPEAFQVGVLGLLRALQTFDPTRAALATYAFGWIRHYIARDRRRMMSRGAWVPVHASLDDELVQLAMHPVSLYAHNDDGDRVTHADPQDPGPLADELLDCAWRRAQVREALRHLPKRDRAVIRVRLANGTLEDAGRKLGRTRERARQVERDAIERLRRLVQPARARAT